VPPGASNAHAAASKSEEAGLAMVQAPAHAPLPVDW
jgi:hypothetical protein